MSKNYVVFWFRQGGQCENYWIACCNWCRYCIMITAVKQPCTDWLQQLNIHHSSHWFDSVLYCTVWRCTCIMLKWECFLSVLWHFWLSTMKLFFLTISNSFLRKVWKINRWRSWVWKTAVNSRLFIFRLYGITYQCVLHWLYGAADDCRQTLDHPSRSVAGSCVVIYN